MITNHNMCTIYVLLEVYLTKRPYTTLIWPYTITGNLRTEYDFLIPSLVTWELNIISLYHHW